MEPATRRTERIDVRVDPETKELLRRAASFEGRSISSFILNAARGRAETILEPEDRIVLSRKDYEQLIARLDEPSEVPEGLRRAIEHIKQTKLPHTA